MSPILFFYALPFLGNCLFVSSAILTPLIRDGSRMGTIEKMPNEVAYILKRHIPSNRIMDPDPKERRSSSSFIRFGRSERGADTVYDALASDAEDISKVNRRWKSPDVIIRFGRSRGKSPRDLHNRDSDLRSDYKDEEGKEDYVADDKIDYL